MNNRDELAEDIRAASSQFSLPLELGEAETIALDLDARGYSKTAATELAELRAIVEKHINMRSEYITALKNSRGSENGDYDRWTGGAEARRQLAEDLGWTVPYEPTDRTAPKTQKES